MTVSRPLSSLNIFHSKVEEAVNLVPGMCAEDKLKAVQFWNTVSEKLQDIINSSAADINDVALKMDEEENAKMSLGINSPANAMMTENEIPNPEFINYNISTDTSVQYHPNITNNQLKHFNSNSLVFSNSNKQPSCEEISHYPLSQQLISGNSNHSDSSGQTDQYIDAENTSMSDCDNSIKDKQLLIGVPVSEIKRDCLKNKDTPFSPKKNSLPSESSWKDKKKIVEYDNSAINSLSVLKTSNVNLEDKFKDKNLSVQPKATSDTSFESLTDFDISNSNEIFQNDETNQASSINDNGCWICSVCSKSFPDEDSLTRHHLRIHERHYTCMDCKAKFTTKSNLLVHMRRHTGEKPFCCHKCPANFTTKGNLQRHIRTHSGAKPWQCTECGTCFTEKKSLTVHMRRHTGERPYQCKECGKKFSQTSILQTHMSMHLDIKMHLCEVCGKSFRQKAQLRVHRLRHDNIRSFQCSTCSSSFLTKGDLIRHEKTHTCEKLYMCDLCSKGFTRQQSLNEHKNRHYGIKPYKCKHCGKAFPEMSGCYKHMKIHVKTKMAEGSHKGNEDEPEHDTSETSPQIVASVSGEHIFFKHMKVSEKAKVEEEDSSKLYGKRIEPLEITSEIDPINKSSTEEKQGNASETTPSYIAVVLNAKDPVELGNEINQAVSFFNSGLEENSCVPNGIGVLTAINFLTNASSFPQNFQNIS